MRPARTLEDFRARGPLPVPDRPLSRCETAAMVATVYAVCSALLYGASLIGWDWMWEYGRLTVGPPVLITSWIFWSWRQRVRPGPPYQPGPWTPREVRFAVRSDAGPRPGRGRHSRN